MCMCPICFAVRPLWGKHTVGFQFPWKFLLFELQWILSKFWQDWVFYYLTLLFHLAGNKETQKLATVARVAKFAWLIWIYFFPCWLNAFLIIDFLDGYTSLFPTFFHMHSFLQTWWKMVINKGYDTGKFTMLKLWIIVGNICEEC